MRPSPYQVRSRIPEGPVALRRTHRLGIQKIVEQKSKVCLRTAYNCTQVFSQQRIQNAVQQLADSTFLTGQLDRFQTAEWHYYSLWLSNAGIINLSRSLLEMHFERVQFNIHDRFVEFF